MSTTQDNASRASYAALGAWNVYFIGKFLLGHYGYLELDALMNALLMLGLLLPLPGRLLRALRQLAALAAGFALLWHETWLPGPESIVGNARALAGFSWNYIWDLALNFINFKMVGWGAALAGAYVLVKDYVRVGLFTGAWLAFSVVAPYIGATLPAPAAPAQQAAGGAAPEPARKTEGDVIQSWYEAFLAYEKERKAALPTGLSAKDTPFDILLLNICSVANDDLEVSNLDHHPALERFNIRFDHFNAATSYSGPATIRLLNGACGQPSHIDLYDQRHPECEIMNRLSTLGYQQKLYLDHGGQYDEYLSQLRQKAGLTAPMIDNASLPVRYMGFNDEEIRDTAAVLGLWRKDAAADKAPRTATLMNFIALHDGNRLPRQGRPLDFKPRTKKFLDDLDAFLTDLEKSGRKVMVVFV
ncbi:MAG: cellulose biosynthesis protein BcsG, partial [Duodenibacillus sp.]|nr:cellulose biosynthesis protein BcsG [Duodenibacillus sp.]